MLYLQADRGLICGCPTEGEPPPPARTGHGFLQCLPAVHLRFFSVQTVYCSWDFLSALDVEHRFSGGIATFSICLLLKFFNSNFLSGVAYSDIAGIAIFKTPARRDFATVSHQTGRVAHTDMSKSTPANGNLIIHPIRNRTASLVLQIGVYAMANGDHPLVDVV